MKGDDDKHIEIPIPLRDVVNIEKDDENGELLLTLRGRSAEVMGKVVFKGVMMHALDRFADFVDVTTSEVSDVKGSEMDSEN